MTVVRSEPKVETPSQARKNTTLAQYRLGRAALDQRQFMAAELAALAQVPINTVYGFIADLGDLVSAEALGHGSVGRPRNVYTLTNEGIDYLLDRNLEIARILRREGTADVARDRDRPTSVSAGELLNELREVVQAEKEHARKLPTLVDKVKPSHVKVNLTEYLEEAKANIVRLEELYESIDSEMRGTRRNRRVSDVQEMKSGQE